MAFWSFVSRLLLGGAEAESGRPPGPARASGEDRDTSARPARPLTVLVATFSGEGGEAATQAVIEALSGSSRGLVVKTTSTVLGPLEDGGASLSGAFCLAVTRGRALAEAVEAQALVWGEATGPQARVWLTPVGLEGDPASGLMLAGDGIDLPLPMGEAADILAAATAAALVLPHDTERRQRLAVLHSALNALEHLAQGAGRSLPAPTQLSLALCHSLAAAELGLKTGQRAYLDQASERLRVLTGKHREALGPLRAAAATAHLADILADSASKEKDKARLEEALGLYREAAKVYGDHALADDHAQIMAQTGRLLHRLSALSGSSSHMKEAVLAYRAAIKIWTKGRAPQRWAELQYAVGTIMAQMGEFTGNVEILTRAAKVFELVAEVWTREETPRRWASLQNNIGAARFAEGKHKSELPPLREAVEKFSFALEVYQSLGMTKNMHVTQKNLIRVERLISTLGGGA